MGLIKGDTRSLDYSSRIGACLHCIIGAVLQPHWKPES